MVGEVLGIVGNRRGIGGEVISIGQLVGEFIVWQNDDLLLLDKER